MTTEVDSAVAAVGEALGGEYESQSPREAIESFIGSDASSEDVQNASDTVQHEGESTNEMPEPEKPGAEETEVETPDGPEPSGPSQAMVGLAKGFGVADETIRALGTDDALSVYLADRMKGGKPEPGNDAPSGVEPVDEFMPFEFDVTLDPEDVTEPIAQWADAVHKYKEHNDKYLSSVGTQVKEMQKVLSQMSQHFANERAQQDQQWFEKQVESLLDKQPEWKDVFGSTRYEQAVNTKFKDAWNEAYAELMDQAERNPRRKTPLAPEQLFTRAIRAVHGDKLEKLARKAIADKDAKMADDHGGLPPTARKSDATRHPDERAIADVKAYLEKTK